MMTKKSDCQYYSRPRPFEVWRFPFEYEDRADVFKERPVVVVGYSEDSRDVLVVIAKVTSQQVRPWCAGEVELRDWQEAGLIKPSVVRCSKILRVPVEFFQGLYKYGQLTSHDSRIVDKALNDLDY